MEYILTIKSIDRFKDLYNIYPSAHWRINASHMPVDDMVNLLTQINDFMTENHFVSPLFIDLQGTKMRLSKDQIEFFVQKGDSVKIFSESKYKSLNETEKTANKDVFLFTDDVYSLLKDNLKPELEVNIDDAKITLNNFSLPKCDGYIEAKVLRANNDRHQVLKRKGINIKPHPIASTDLMPRDINIIKKTEHFKFVSYCLSFINSFEELKALRDQIPIEKFIVAKLELPLKIETIQKMVDQIKNTNYWLCRGDLGSQLSPVELMQYYTTFNRQIVEKNYKKARFVLAGEVMDHLLCDSYPTRSEICHLADAINFGYRGFVLSNETAFGKYYKECADFMTKNCDAYFKTLNQ